LGCRVIGIAGGPKKCAWLTETCGLDAAVDYRNGGVMEKLRELCPDGIDIFYDNVGGEILQAAIENMAKFGRVVLCGQIATYTEGGPARDPNNTMRLIYGGVTMQGFLHSDYEADVDAALAQLRDWVERGLIVQRADARSGFKNIPQTFSALFDGGNEGTLLATLE
jgi:NADPH-dependent curcumin reductase CurA